MTTYILFIWFICIACQEIVNTMKKKEEESQS